MLVTINLDNGGFIAVQVASVEAGQRILAVARRHGKRAVLRWQLKPFPGPAGGPLLRPSASGG